MASYSEQLFFSFGQLSYSEIYSFFELTTDDFESFKNEDFKQQYAKKLSEKAKFVFCRNTNGELIGMIAAYINNLSTCYISHVSVFHSYQRHGIFSTMYNILEQEVIDFGGKEIKLEVRKDNKPALKTYTTKGFNITGDSKKGYAYMSKNLDIKNMSVKIDGFLGR